MTDLIEDNFKIINEEILLVFWYNNGINVLRPFGVFLLNSMFTFVDVQNSAY